MKREEKEAERLKEQARIDGERSQEERNRLGQFATPPDLARLIVEDALQRNPEAKSCLEPACGTGSFISAIRDIDDSIDITAIEQDEEFWTIANKLWGNKKGKIIHADFFEAERGCTDRFDIIVSNPPYSRHHHLSHKQKEDYARAVEEKTGKHMSQLAGLHAYFILVGTSMLNEGGIASWLIPSELFSVNYGETVKDYLTTQTCIERIHFFNNNDLQFSDALVSSCVITTRNKKPTPDHLIEITSGNYAFPAKSKKVSNRELRNIKKWQHAFLENGHAPEQNIGSMFSVSRGISTGGDRFFIKNREEWHAIGIGDEWLQPILPPPRYLKQNDVKRGKGGWAKGLDRALLRIPKNIPIEELPEPVREYLSQVPSKTAHGYTLTHRTPWYAVEERKPAPIVCNYMSRSSESPFRFIRNRSDAVVTTAYLCLYPIANLDDKDIDAIQSLLNSIPAEQLINSGREYGGGLRKLEPSELLAVPVDFSNVQKNEGAEVCK